MKKQLLSFGLIMGLAGAVTAQQQVNNSGFETWDNLGSNTEEPAEWNSMMTGNLCGLCGFGASQRVFQDNTQTRPGTSGTYSARIETGVAFGNGVNGTMTTGKVNAPSTTPADGFTQSETGGTEFSEAITDQPDSLIFWAFYDPADATLARVSAGLHTTYDQKNPYSNDANTDVNINADISMDFVTGGAWQRMAMAFDYSVGSATTNTFLLITYASTADVPAPTSADGAKLYVDDMMLVYNITPDYTGLTNACPGDSGPIAFSSNSTTTMDRIFSLELSDASGSFASPTIVGTTTITSGNPGSGSITGTIPMGTTPGTGYKLRVTQSDASYASIEGPAFAVDPSETAGTLAGSNITNCATPDGAVTLTGSSGSSFDLYDSGNNLVTTNATGNFTGLGADDYYVVVSGTNCDATTNTVTVSNASAPAAPTAGADADYCDGQTPIDLTATAGSGGTLQWYLGGNSESTGATQTPLATIGTHVYTVTETLTGCESAPTTVTVVVGANPTMSGETGTAVTDCTPANGTATVTSDGTSFELFDATFNSITTNATGMFNGLGAADYYITATLGNCTATSAAITVGDNTGLNTVTAAPTTMQTLAIATAGTMITATESSTSANGEWKVSNVSGSGYNSFAPTETALTYTPNFANGGTYYVVYTATINGCMLMSTETEIVVGNVGVGENENGNVTVYSFEKQVFIDLSNTTLNNPIVKLVSTNGKVVLERRLNNGTMNTLNVDVPTGIYIFHIISNDGATTGKVVLK